MITTIFLPRASGRAPISSAAATAAPEEMPTGMPSMRASRARGLERGLVADRDDLVDDLAVEHLGHEARADALDLVRAGRAAGQHRGNPPARRRPPSARAAGLQHLADARDGAARADARDEIVDSPCVSFQISSAVVRRWMSGLAGLRNCWGIIEPGIFDGVEIHGANGYLVDQFLRDGSNRRSDAYGGSVGNRMRLLNEILDAVSEVWPAGRIGVRLTPENSFNDMVDSDPQAHSSTSYGSLVLSTLPMSRASGGYV